MKRILVADDDREIVESLKDMLSPFYEVETATTGREIMQRFREQMYHGLILDIDFGPGVSGLEIASLLRAKYKNLKILVFSATDYSDAVRQQVIDIGAVFFEKPLRLDSVRRIMEA